VVLCIDEMGPLSARSYPGRELVRGRAGRAKRELERDRDRKLGGYVFGAFRPATGEALTETYESRSIVTFVDFLEKVEAWVPESVGRIYAIMDNLKAHKAYDVLLFNVAHPRWEFVFQPKYAAYLNLIEPWWKTLRSLALAGRDFESWRESRSRSARLGTTGTSAATPTSGAGAGGAGGTGPHGAPASEPCQRSRPRVGEGVPNLADEPVAVATQAPPTGGPARSWPPPALSPRALRPNQLPARSSCAYQERQSRRPGLDPGEVPVPQGGREREHAGE
jgi:transposase